MPRHFFHTPGVTPERDSTGTSFPDFGTARVEAIRLAGRILAENPAVLSDGRDFRVEMTDGRGNVLLSVTVLAVESPRPRRRKPASS